MSYELSKTVFLEDTGARNVVGDSLLVGDYVRIVPDLYDAGCECCDYEVGIDDCMTDYEGRWWFVDRVCDREGWRHLSCGGRVFEVDDWFFSTCWINAIRVKKPPVPSWEV